LKSNKVSRRSFLKGLPLGLLGVSAIGLFSGKMISSAANRKAPKFKKGSIFTPRDSDIRG
tara:strand:+ start:203 stop:382 length:180 start_codon:yes stop_codon:yes gene_type:complete